VLSWTARCLFLLFFPIRTSWRRWMGGEVLLYFHGRLDKVLDSKSQTFACRSLSPNQRHGEIDAKFLKLGWVYPGVCYATYATEIRRSSRPECNETLNTLKSKPQLTCCEYWGRPNEAIWIDRSLSSCF
jgi:hypothetical protein